MTQDENQLLDTTEHLNSDITFLSNNEERIKICADGSFLVNGKKISEDIELYKAFVAFLKENGFYH
jgi:sRNA-binding regulator protein Hfq